MPLTALARAVATDVGGRTRLTTLRSCVPLSLRETADGLTVVASAFGPLGGDRTRLEVEVGAGAQLCVGAAAAQVAQPGPVDPVSHAEVDLRVASGGRLLWRPRPLVVTAGAEHRLGLRARVHGSARVVLVETAVLGRSGQGPGRYRSRWRIDCDDEPLLAADLDVGTGAPDGWSGPAVVGAARVLITALVTGPHLPPVTGLVDGQAMQLAGPGVLFSWLGDDPVRGAAAVTAFLDRLPAAA